MIEYGTRAYWRATISLSMASFFVFDGISDPTDDAFIHARIWR